jgi:sRNA-binding carbon storage regulator CsrA
MLILERWTDSEELSDITITVPPSTETQTILIRLVRIKNFGSKWGPSARLAFEAPHDIQILRADANNACRD